MCRISGIFGIFHFILFVYPVIIQAQTSHSFRTPLDRYSNLLILIKRFTWLSSEDVSQMYRKNMKSKTLQHIASNTTKFYCDTEKGPGHRSLSIPNSVNKIRPGDIDIIAAIGDSITSGNGAIFTEVSHILNEYRDISWPAGGRANWRKYLTIPNILKEFNPNLYGFSDSRSLTTDKGSKFNVAEPIGMSPDMTYQARTIINRMKSDPKVDMEKHWKLFTIFIGNTDFCTDSCNYANYEEWVNLHEKDLIKVLRTLRDNVPRTIVNIVSVPNFVELRKLRDVSLACFVIQRFGCSCLFNSHVSTMAANRAINLWYQIEDKVANMTEFHTQNFTVVVQPFFQGFKLPKTELGKVDMRYFSIDCLHFSQLGHAFCATNVWNNMLQPVGKKITSINYDDDRIQCPTEKRPYIATRGNSEEVE